MQIGNGPVGDLISRYQNADPHDDLSWEAAVAAAQARAEIATQLSTAPITTPDDAAAVLDVISDQLSIDELSPQHPARLLTIALYNYLIAQGACVVCLLEAMV